MLVMLKGYESPLETKNWQQKAGATSTWLGWAGGTYPVATEPVGSPHLVTGK